MSTVPQTARPSLPSCTRNEAGIKQEAPSTKPQDPGTRSEALDPSTKSQERRMSQPTHELPAIFRTTPYHWACGQSLRTMYFRCTLPSDHPVVDGFASRKAICPDGIHERSLTIWFARRPIPLYSDLSLRDTIDR